MKIIKILFLIGLSVLMVSCGKTSSNNPKPLPPTYGVEADFVPLVDEFYNEASGRNINLARNLVIVMKTTLSAGGAGTIGVCFYPSAERRFPYIEVKRSFWETATDQAKRNLVFHELGHCLLFRDHSTAQQYAPIMGKTIPLSIMFPYIIITMSSDITTFYETYLVDYLNELFDGSTVGTIRGYASTSLNQDFDPEYIPVMGGYSSTEEDGLCDHAHGEH